MSAFRCVLKRLEPVRNQTFLSGHQLPAFDPLQMVNSPESGHLKGLLWLRLQTLLRQAIGALQRLSVLAFVSDRVDH